MDWRDFTLADPVAAESSLGTFAPAVKEKGEETFRRGIIQNIRCLDPHASFAGSVTGLRPCEVALRFDPGAVGWKPDCTCPAGPQCEHAYALTRHLLTRHQLIAGNAPKPAAGKKSARKTSTAIAAPTTPSRQLSESTSSSTSRASTPAAPTSAAAATVAPSITPKPSPLEDRLLARQIVLNSEDRAFLGQISDLYRRFGRRPAIPKLELERLGLSKPAGTTSNFDGVQLWRSLPNDEYDFWLYVALHAEEKGLGIPNFLKPISDLEPLRRRLAHERRQQEIEHWRQVLATWGTPASDEAATPGATDLRIRFSEAEALLEWRRNATEEFEAMKAHQFERFSQTHVGRGLVAPEGMLLWNAFQQCLAVNGYKKPALNASEPNSRRTLAFLLRQPGLSSRLVNAEGEPLARPSAPLRWQLIPPEQVQGDYRLRLVQPDGTTAPTIHATFPGEPTLFLASDTIFTGPPVDDRLLALNTETTVPAAAVESRGGVRFLRNLGLDLPPRLVDRVRLIPLKPLLRLDLRQLTHGSDAEHCTMEVLGISADATLVERWNGSQWQEPPGSKPVESTAPAGTDQIVSVDRTHLAGISQHIEAGGFRWDFARHVWTLRVTRMFPDRFVPWLQSLPKDLAVELRGELGSFLNAEVSGRVRLAVAESDSIDWFDLRVVLDVSDTSLTKDELKLLLDARGRWVRLGSKGWRRLDFQLSAAEDEQLARLGLSPHELSADSQRLHVLQIDPEAATGLLPEETLLRIRIRTQEIRTRVNPDKPESVHAELRPYQLEGFHYLAYLATNGFGGVLADDMGLGKTLQTLTWIAWLRDETAAGRIASRPAPGAKARKGRTEGIPPILVVCPKSVCDNWRAEAERFTPHLRIRAWRGTELERMPSRLGEADIHILNYNQLRSIGETLAENQFLAVVLDEGQYIKNPSSVTALIAKTLRADHRLVLSARRSRTVYSTCGA